MLVIESGLFGSKSIAWKSAAGRVPVLSLKSTSNAMACSFRVLVALARCIRAARSGLFSGAELNVTDSGG